MIRIALVTAAGIGLAEDDRLLVGPMLARGWDAVSVAWDDPSVVWSDFDLVWLRSCWDYHRRHDEFTAWLDRADGAGTRWVNPAPVVRWNAHKRYLLDLAEAGIPVPPLRIVRTGTPFDGAGFLADTDWPETIIKPAVSASAYRTWRTGGVPPETSAARMTKILADGDLILQRFVPEVGTHGEWSLIFVDDELSHAVRKVPRAGEFRSQRDHGATIVLEMPSSRLIDVGRAALAYAAARHGAPRFARLDLIDAPAGPLVMEVELIEPVLFFGYAEDAPARAVDALARAMSSQAALRD